MPLARLAAAEPAVEASLSSQFLVRGEAAALEIVVSDGRPESMPTLPEIPGVSVRSETLGMAQTRILAGRTLAYVFTYTLASFTPGKYEVPPVAVQVNGQVVRTQPLKFEVFPTDRLVWQETALGTAQVRYATFFAAAAPSPFENQSVPVELKIYFPVTERVEEWGIPDFERDGLNVWRFEPSRLNGSASLNGTTYASVSYPSTLTPTRAGKVSLGPGKLRLMTIQSVPDVFGYRSIYQPAQLTVAPLELTARELPAGAPKGFEQAVGSFTLKAAVEETNLTAGDPANVTLTVSGRGNLDSVRVPKLLDASGWKLYDAVPRQRGVERRSITGEVSFSQLIRPLEPKTLIPPFRLVYFDPDEESYKILLSEPIKLAVSGATPGGLGAAPSAGARPMPSEQMGDILSIIEVDPAATRRPGAALPNWSWQVIPALIALGLVLAYLGRRLAPRWVKNPDELAKRAALRAVEQAPADGMGFYRAAGKFIESWLGDDPAEEVKGILAERDRRCFLPDGADNAKLPLPQRQAVLRTLRRHALLCLLVAGGFLLTTGSGLAAETLKSRYADAEAAYRKGQFAEAARGFAAAHPTGDCPADVLYNIGNCYYRLDQQGYAALFYRRALLEDPGHVEARQNLRFLEKSLGSLVVPHTETELMIGAVSLETWESLLLLGGWLVLIGVLALLLTPRGSAWKPTAIALLVLGPVLALGGALGWRHYPDDARFAAVGDQMVVVDADATVRTAASRRAKKVISAPPGSLAEVIATRGDWTYIGFATKTRGWVPRAAVEPLVVHGPLELNSLVERPAPPAPQPKMTPGA
jgi:tetratricopeptide (TPR) repeat protein